MSLHYITSQLLSIYKELQLKRQFLMAVFRNRLSSIT